MKNVLINDSGNIRNGTIDELMYSSSFRNAMLEVLREELRDQNSEILTLLELAMNTIADKEIIKVLE